MVKMTLSLVVVQMILLAVSSAASQPVIASGKGKLSPSQKLLRKGDKLRDAWQNEEALLVYNKAVAVDPDNPYCYLERGACYAEMKQFDRAKQDFERALKLDPRNGAVYRERGKMYEFQGNTALALSNYSKAVGLDPKDYLSYAGKAFIYRSKGDYEPAIREWNYAIKLRPDKKAYLRSRAEVYELMGRFDRAIEDYKSIIKIRWSDKELTRIGEDYVRIGKYPQAIEYYSKVLRHNPKDEHLYVRRAEAFMGAKRYAQARRDLDTAIKLQDNLGTAYFLRARLFKELGDAARSAADLKLAEKHGCPDQKILMQSIRRRIVPK